MTMKQKAGTEMVNGVNVGKLFETIDAIRQTPNLAVFKFRLNNEWIDGGLNRSTMKNFYGAGQEDTARQEPFVLEADEPPVLLGKDMAPNRRTFQNGGYAAAFSSASLEGNCVPGYQRRNVFRRSSFRTCVRTCSKKCAPRSVQRICCLFTIRLLTT